MKKKYQYPWRYNNFFELLVDGTDYFSSMLKEIKNSKEIILFESYLFESGKIANSFINELILAKKRGINVLLLLDEFGSKNLNAIDKNTLLEAKIELVFYNPVNIFQPGKSLRRNHRKLLIIDENIAFIGGAGITDQFSENISDNAWHDVMLKIKGDIISDLRHSFYQIWGEERSPLIIEATKKPKKEENKSHVLIASGTERNEIIRAIITRIRASKDRVWLTSPYFISSWKIRRALRYAAKKGVDVRLLFPGPYSDHRWVNYGIQRYYRRLLKAKILIYEFQPRFNHAKIILCDNWYSLGSSNLDRWNQFLNLDANIEVYDAKSHQQIFNLFEENFIKSELITYEKWKNRGLVQHIKEWFSGVIILLLSFISHKFKR